MSDRSLVLAMTPGVGAEQPEGPPFSQRSDGGTIALK